MQQTNSRDLGLRVVADDTQNVVWGLTVCGRTGTLQLLTVPFPSLPFPQDSHPPHGSCPLSCDHAEHRGCGEVLDV